MDMKCVRISFAFLICLFVMGISCTTTGSVSAPTTGKITPKAGVWSASIQIPESGGDKLTFNLDFVVSADGKQISRAQLSHFIGELTDSTIISGAFANNPSTIQNNSFTISFWEPNGSYNETYDFKGTFTSSIEAKGVLPITGKDYSWTASPNNSSGLPGLPQEATLAKNTATPTIKGVYKSTDGGRNWVNTGLSNNDICTLAIDPSTPATLYAGTSENGIFKSTDGGGNWRAVNTGLTTDIYVWAIAIDPVTPTTLYASTLGGGVYKSIDGGENWNAASIGLTNTYIRAIAIDPSTPNTIYTGAGSGHGLFTSTDGASNWSPIDTGSYKPEAYAFAINPFIPTTVYAGTDDGLFKSTNDGEKWINIDPPATIYTKVEALAIDPVTPSILYAGRKSSFAKGGLYKSIDGGENWNTTGLTEAFINALVIDPAAPATLYAATSNHGIFKSTDGGGNWTAVNTGLKVSDVWDIVIDPATPAILYAGTRE